MSSSDLQMLRESGLPGKESEGWEYCIFPTTYMDLVERACLEETESGTGRSSRDGEESFSGTKTFEEARDLAITGWPEGTARIEEMQRKAAVELATMETNEFKTYHSFEGAFVDVGRFVEGDPECMVQFMPVPPKKHLTLFFNLTTCGGESTEAMEKASAYLAAAVEHLQDSANITFSIFGGEQTYNGRYAVSIWFPVRASQYAMSMDMLAFALGHPAMLRRILFGFEETLPVDIVKKLGFCVGGGYGCALHSPPPPYLDAYKPYVFISRQDIMHKDLKDVLKILEKKTHEALSAG